MQHEHVSFYSNATRLGGSDLIPGLIGNAAASSSSGIEDTRTFPEKQAEIVEYLQKLGSNIRATSIDFRKSLGINVDTDQKLLNSLKNNPKIDTEVSLSGVLSFQYRSKFAISNQRELKHMINRVRTGLVLRDIKDCYPGIEKDIALMLRSGEIIACKNKEIKSGGTVLFPRGEPFYTQLSGIVKAKPGDRFITTTENVTEEIRRGDAVHIGGAEEDDAWYRISSIVKSTTGEQTLQRAHAPLSVTSFVDLSEKNVYTEPFTATHIPLDLEYDGKEEYEGIALRHGVTNDVRNIWKRTADDIKAFQGDEAELRRKLVEWALITDRPDGLWNDGSSAGGRGPSGGRRRGGRGGRGPRAPRKPGANSAVANNGYGVNAHLRGTDAERILQETDELNYKMDLEAAKQRY